METKTKIAAFFDLDGTLLRGESQFSFMLHCWRLGLAPSFRTPLVAAKYSLYLIGLSRDAHELRESGFALFAGLSVKKMESASADFSTSTLGRRVRRHSAALISKHRKCGHVTILVTSACEIVARPIGSQLGFDVIIATRLPANNGIFTGGRELPEPYAEGKRQVVANYCASNRISPSDSFAYADHHSDLPILEFVGHPVATNPTARLHSVARARNWPVLDLDSGEIPHFEVFDTLRPC